jgi:hypothetical protein
MQRSSTGSGGVPFGTEIGHAMETCLKAAEVGFVAAQFIVGLAHQLFHSLANVAGADA